MMRGAVVDASLALSWILPDEQSEAGLSLRDRAVLEPTFALLAPPIFWYEVSNVLWVATRRGRLDLKSARETLVALRAFSVEEWSADPQRRPELALSDGISGVLS